MRGVSDEVRLVAVNVGQPGVIGTRHGEPVLSGIRKRLVAEAVVRLDRLNLAGDRQADQRWHGGLDKAVYAYPSEHFPAWAAELGRPVGPAAFGENLTTAGPVEADVRIGDVWAWGDALLQVVQPRWPCFKLAIHSRTPDMAARFRGQRAHRLVPAGAPARRGAGGRAHPGGRARPHRGNSFRRPPRRPPGRARRSGQARSRRRRPGR